jgi:hypothetical protein
MDHQERVEYMKSWAANDLSEFIEAHDDFLREQFHEGKFPPSWFAVMHQAYIVLRGAGCPSDEIQQMLNGIEKQVKENDRNEVTLH